MTLFCREADWDDDDDDWDNALLNKYKHLLGDSEPTEEEMEYERLTNVGVLL